MQKKITTGFLVGNLLNDWTGVDRDATALRYSKVCEYAIRRAFPGCDVMVDYREGEGATPLDLATWVEGNPDISTDDADAERVDRICRAVWSETSRWIVKSD